MQYMYSNGSNKLKYRDRLNIIKQWNSGRKPSKIADFWMISRQTVYKIIAKYKQEDVYGLQDHRPGILKKELSPLFYAKVKELRLKQGWGALRIEKYLNKKGFIVTHNKINQVIKQEGLTRPKMGKREKPKYIRYEAENNNDQWHIDWSSDPLSNQYLLAIIDDKSRYIVFAGLFDSASAENSALGLETAIKMHGAPKELVSDNGSHYKNVHTKKVPCEPMKLIEEKYAIKHIFIRAYYPQSNGKIERWFGSYKNEFKYMNHPDVKDLYSWVVYYNHERPHQSLDYDTPAYVYLGIPQRV
jgi:transposase